METILYMLYIMETSNKKTTPPTAHSSTRKCIKTALKLNIDTTTHDINLKPERASHDPMVSMRKTTDNRETGNHLISQSRPPPPRCTRSHGTTAGVEGA
jgi:imidazolonepropionase-like amidohydrolase